MTRNADNRTTELKSLSKLKMAGKLRYWRGAIEIPEDELHAICDEIQAEHDRAIAATVGNGTLTAEQVREAIERHSAWVIGNNRCFHDGAYEEIADELNATFGAGECEMETDWDYLTDGIPDAPEDTWAYMCSSCDWSFRYDRGIKPSYCPNCGKAVTR